MDPHRLSMLKQRHAANIDMFERCVRQYRATNDATQADIGFNHKHTAAGMREAMSILGLHSEYEAASRYECAAMDRLFGTMLVGGAA